MKQLVYTLALMAIFMYSSCSFAQRQQLVKIWETDSTLKVPESVLYYPQDQVLFVSNIDGKPSEKDGKGSISKVSMDGKIIKADWAINLSAPKGMGIYQQTLFVADVDEVVAIDMKTARVSKRIPVKGAGFLNDITIDNSGIVYVSDSETGIIHRIQQEKVSTFLENQKGLNGLLASGDDLYLLAGGELWKADKSKKLSKIAGGMDESTDGLEQTSDKGFIISCWSGVIYSVQPDGSKEKLLDTEAQKVNSADIGFDPKSNIVYVPTFFGNTVVAYQLK